MDAHTLNGDWVHGMYINHHLLALIGHSDPQTMVLYLTQPVHCFSYHPPLPSHSCGWAVCCFQVNLNGSQYYDVRCFIHLMLMQVRLMHEVHTLVCVRAWVRARVCVHLFVRVHLDAFSTACHQKVAVYIDVVTEMYACSYVPTHLFDCMFSANLCICPKSNLYIQAASLCF